MANAGNVAECECGKCCGIRIRPSYLAPFLREIPHHFVQKDASYECRMRIARNVVTGLWWERSTKNAISHKKGARYEWGMRIARHFVAGLRWELPFFVTTPTEDQSLNVAHFAFAPHNVHLFSVLFRRSHRRLRTTCRALRIRSP